MNAACGVADLVRGFERLGPAGLDTMARVLGYVPVPRAATEESKDAAMPREEGSADLPIRTMYQFVEVPLWRVVSFDPKDDPLGEDPHDDRSCDHAAVVGEPPAMKPIVPWPRLLSHLRPFLTRDESRRSIDLSRAVERVARGELLGAAPITRRRRLASRALVIADNRRSMAPYGADVTELVARLSRLLGNGRAMLWSFDNGPEHYCDTLNRGPSGAIHEPGVGDPILLLSDLGFRDGRRTAEWLRFGRRLRSAGHRIRALVPDNPAALPVDLAATWQPARWDRRVDAESADEATARGLLRLLAPAVCIEPGLLRGAREQLLPRAGADLEAEVWLLREVSSGWRSLVSVREEVAAEQRARWLETSDREQRVVVVDLLRRWHATARPDVWYEEALRIHQLDPTLLAWSEVEAARDALLAILEQLAVDEESGVERQVQGSWVVALSIRSPELLADQQVARALARVRKFLPRVQVPAEVGERIAEAPSRQDRGRWMVAATRTLRTTPFDPRHPSEPEGVPGLLAHIVARRRTLHVSARGRNTSLALESAAVLDELPDGPCRLETDLGTWHVERVTCPAWAVGVGRDRYGLWADIRVGAVRHRLRWIPPGRFWMGSPPDEQGRFDDETRHEVVLTRGYWLGETPVTQELYEAVVGDNPSAFKTPDRPVETVSWHDARGFAERLDAKLHRRPDAPAANDGLVWRLPTEAEWEHACRAGTTTSTYAGELRIEGANNGPLLDAIAWYGGNSGMAFELGDQGANSTSWPNKQYDHQRTGTHPVKQERTHIEDSNNRRDPRNGFGLYDMLGNVWEWCSDWAVSYAEGMAVDPEGPSTGSNRVLRGGSWDFNAWNCRSAQRSAHVPGARTRSVGFRVARGPEPAREPGPGAEPHPQPEADSETRQVEKP